MPRPLSSKSLGRKETAGEDPGDHMPMAKVARSGEEQSKQTDRELMLRAIALARQSKGEPGKIAPKVGAIIARAGKPLGGAFRGELAPGEHAEFTLLEKKLPHETLAGGNALYDIGALHVT